MEIYKTKAEKKVEAIAESAALIEQVIGKIEESGKIKIKFDRIDFKSKLSTTIGYGFQDLKKKNRMFITELIKKDYDINFKPIFDNLGFSVLLTIKKN